MMIALVLALAAALHQDGGEVLHLDVSGGVRVVLDIDYRPVLWGLTSRGLGEQRGGVVGRVGEEYYLATWTGISGDRFYRNAPGADFTTFTDAWVDAHVRGRGPRDTYG